MLTTSHASTVRLHIDPSKTTTRSACRFLKIIIVLEIERNCVSCVDQQRPASFRWPVKSHAKSSLVTRSNANYRLPGRSAWLVFRRPWSDPRRPAGLCRPRGPASAPASVLLHSRRLSSSLYRRGRDGEWTDIGGGCCMGLGDIMQVSKLSPHMPVIGFGTQVSCMCCRIHVNMTTFSCIMNLYSSKFIRIVNDV